MKSDHHTVTWYINSGPGVLRQEDMLQKSYPMGSPNEDGQQGSWISSAVATEGFIRGFPGSSDGKESACNVGEPGSIPASGRSPGGRARQPTPVFLPGDSRRQRSLAGYGPWAHKSRT